MPATTPQKDYLAGNVIWPCDIWKITARDGTVAAYASHTRDLIYSSVTYKATPNEPSTSVMQIGLEADTSEMTGVYDDTITKANVEAGKWKRAAIQKEILLDYRTPSFGTTRIQKGYVGKIEPMGNYSYKLEFKSITDLLRQTTGDLTSNIDRLRTIDELGVTVGSFTHATTVYTVTDRRKFKINYAQPYADYFLNGRVVWTSGTNNGLQMEIKSAVLTNSNTKTELELHLPMPSTISASEGLNVIRGYKGGVDDAKLIGATAVLNSQAEWHIPSLGFTLRYPE